MSGDFEDPTLPLKVIMVFVADAGWHLIEAREPAAAACDPCSVFAEKGGSLAVAVLHRGENGTSVTLLEASGDGRSHLQPERTQQQP